MVKVALFKSYLRKQMSLRSFVVQSIITLLITTQIEHLVYAAQLSGQNCNTNSDICSTNKINNNNNQYEEKTADLTKLINETLAINNKSIPNSARSTLKDDWTFDRVEYDLMEFLQDLSARYKLNNASSPPSSSGEEESVYGDYLKEASLEAKRIQSSPNTKETSNETFVPEITVNKSTSTSTTTTITKSITTTSTSTTLTSKSSSAPSTTESTVSKLDASFESPPNLPSSIEPPVAASSDKSRPTLSPQLSTSLASGEPEIAESSWQYGIFDRFTRPKSTTTTTKEPVLDSNSGLNVRNFNSNECGLRIYDIGSEILQSQPEFEAEASKELNQRRQRPFLNSITSSHKKYQFETVADSANTNSGDNTNSKGNENDNKAYDAYDSYDKQDSSSNFEEDQANPPSSDETADNEFNLASRRHWLQQQLGNTLQLLGFNASSQSAAEYLNQTSGLSLNMRENMMKKSGKMGRKASPLNSINSNADDNLNSRLDDLKLEARVIGGNDARLGDSPWSVSLQALVSKPGTVGVEYRHYCGGTIISENYVLTAAHCLDFMVGRESRLFVVMGDLNWRMSTASLYGRRFGIEKLIIHSGYKSTAFGHDIGLIKTKEPMKPLKVNGRYIINSVCLPERNVEHSGEAELVGWGLFSNRNEMADTLQVADVPILPRPLCVDLYKRRTGLIQWLIGIELITDKQVCAGTFGRGICQGDSGSALVVNEKVYNQRRPTKQVAKYLRGASSNQVEQTKATIIGVVAFGGIRRCSYQSLPGVYMQISKYLDWILPRIAS